MTIVPDEWEPSLAAAYGIAADKPQQEPPDHCGAAGRELKRRNDGTVYVECGETTEPVHHSVSS